MLASAQLVVTMFKLFIRNLPSIKFWLANVVFWLVLNTLAASYSYRVAVHYERPSTFIAIWLEYLPWWGNWALLTPMIIAATATIEFNRRHLAKFILYNSYVVIAVFTFYWGLTLLEVSIIKHGSISLEVLTDALNRLWLSPLHMDFIVYLAVFGAGYAITYYKSANEQIIKNEQLAKQLIQVELHSLKSQLNPHFLFNTLNTIASLIRLDRKSNAVKALSELSLMLRKVLENQNNQMISLKQEIDFIESYLTIQKMRFENKLETEIIIEDGCSLIEVPFMLLQPLVENAVQHGSQLESNKNTLRLHIKIHNDKLEVSLTNKVPEKNENQGFGIGLKNCRQRMEKIYPENFTLNLSKLDNDYFQTLLTLPLGQ